MPIILFLIALLAFPVRNANADVAAHDHKCIEDFPTADYPYHWTPNHCGPDDWRRPFIPNKIFLGAVDLRPACDGHDRCTMIVGKGHTECVREFRAELKRICRREYPSIAQTPLRESCLVIVEGFASAVQDFGADRHWQGQRDQQRFEKCVAEHGFQPRNAFRCVNGTCVPKAVAAYTRDELFEEMEEALHHPGMDANQTMAREWLRRVTIERAEFAANAPLREAQEKARLARIAKYEGLLEMPLASLEALALDMTVGKAKEDLRVFDLLLEWKAEYADKKQHPDMGVEFDYWVSQAYGRKSLIIENEVKARGLETVFANLDLKYRGKTLRTQRCNGVAECTIEDYKPPVP